MFPNLAPILRRADRPLFVLWTATNTLLSARSFYGYMLKQTGGEWSAPLDDVFIHFDYARATALGHPFEWTIGNGYSSGNTSLTYPFVLAFGWLLGFTGRSLMKWAAILAAMSVFGTILAARRLFLEGPRDDWGRISSYLLPPVFLGIGALVWSLWSGMEVAFFLATWALALVAWLRVDAEARAAPFGQIPVSRLWWLGAAGALLVATRPEAAFTIAVFGLAAAHAYRHRGLRPALGILLRTGLPAVSVLVIQALVNRALTGESSANGAIVKLALNNPFMTGEEKLADWVFNVKYAALRNLDYHFAHIEGDWERELVEAWPGAPGFAVYLAKTAWWAGVVPLVLAVLPLCFRRTRLVAVVVWAQIVGWVVLVAFNGQVRWQNERYVMPAVAWAMIMAALGVSVALRRTEGVGSSARKALRPRIVTTLVVSALIVQAVGVLTRPVGMPPVFRLSWLLALACGAGAVALLRPYVVRAPLVLLLLVFAWDHQLPKMRDQKWFFGRASRNIRDQHLTLGKYLAETKPRRVLVGDAGAILYESNRPGLDIIGLGGYHGLPFARAGVQGLPATLELIERIPKGDRPDVLAIFPTWWGILPIWFGDEVLRRFPVEGNVICGGYEHVVYRANWALLNTGDEMRWTPPRDWNGGLAERVRATIDTADLVSEKQHDYVFETPQNGWTEMRLLPDPVDPQRDMFDSGRRIAIGKSESFEVRGLVLGKRAHLVVRLAQESKTHVRVRVDGEDAETAPLERIDGWEERAILLRPELVKDRIRIELTNEGPGDFVDYHAWVTQ